MSTAAVLLAGLQAVRSAFRQVDIVGVDDSLTVELSYDAGHRFECWFVANAAPQTSYDPEYCRTSDGPVPMRTINFHGVKVTWPVKRVALPSGRSAPAPLPIEALTLRDFRK